MAGRIRRRIRTLTDKTTIPITHHYVQGGIASASPPRARQAQQPAGGGRGRRRRSGRRRCCARRYRTGSSGPPGRGPPCATAPPGGRGRQASAGRTRPGRPSRSGCRCGSGRCCRRRPGQPSGRRGCIDLCLPALKRGDSPPAVVPVISGPSVGWVPGSSPRRVGFVRAAGLLPGLTCDPQAFTPLVAERGPPVRGWAVLFGQTAWSMRRPS